jgi:hypothetical protein
MQVVVAGDEMMQISRHWRMNAQRYRLEGVRLENGAVSLDECHTQAFVEETQHEAMLITQTQNEQNAEVNAA